MSINNLRRTPAWLPGAGAAFLAGSLVAILGSATDQLRILLAEPAIVGLGLAVASVLGGWLAPRVVTSRLRVALAIAVAYGLSVPIVVAVIIALPLAPVAAMFAIVAWPVTVPAALAWLLLTRWKRSRDRLGEVQSAAAAVALATLLLVLRFTQPAATASAAAGDCVTFPGERIGSIALSPDGAWLGAGSERDGEGIVRVIEQASGKIFELARGPYVDAASSGVAVGPGGATIYLVNVQGAVVQPQDAAAAVWLASPTEAARRFADLSTPGVSDLTWTPDGIAAVQWVDPATWTETHRLVWVRPSTGTADAFEPIAPDRVLDYPVLAPLVSTAAEGRITVRTPRGDRTLDRPSDADGEVSVTEDGAFLVFHARELAEDGDDKYSYVVAQSTEDDRRTVLAPGPGWMSKIAAGKLAYVTFPEYPDNMVCVKAVAIE